MHPWQKKATVADRKTDEWISLRSESFRYLLLLQQQLFRPHSFSQQHQSWSELCQTTQHQCNLCIGSVAKRLTWRTELCDLIGTHCTDRSGQTVVWQCCHADLSSLLFWKGPGHETKSCVCTWMQGQLESFSNVTGLTCKVRRCNKQCVIWCSTGCNLRAASGICGGAWHTFVRAITIPRCATTATATSCSRFHWTCIVNQRLTTLCRNWLQI